MVGNLFKREKGEDGRRGRMGGEGGWEEREERGEGGEGGGGGERREKMKMGEDGRRQTGEWVEETQTVSHHGNLIYHHFYCLPSDLVL